MASPPALVHQLALPAGTSGVEGVFVNGVALVAGEDYSVGAGLLRIHRGVRPARGLSGRDLLKIALCVEVVPKGDTIDALVVRDGRIRSVSLPLDRTSPPDTPATAACPTPTP